MNNESFEKMDREFLTHLRSVREKKVPEGIRRKFKSSVEERLLSSARPGSFGLPFIIAPAFVLLLGAVMCWIYLKPAGTVRENIPGEMELQKKDIYVQTQAVPAEVSASTVVVPLAKKDIQSNVQVVTMPKLNSPILSQITESNVVSELEALKELGVWSEKDEEEIGVSSDQIFEELETLAGELISGTNSVNVQSSSTQG